MITREGTVVSVLSSPSHGFPTYPQEAVTVNMDGIAGDAHSGPDRESFTQPGTLKSNDRPISVVPKEMLELVNQTLGLNMQPGDFNEQLLVSGLGDLGWVVIGAIITFAESPVVLEVVDYAYPCKKLEEHNKSKKGKLIELLLDPTRKNEMGKPYSRRGILTKVIQPGVLRPGDTVKIGVPEN